MADTATQNHSCHIQPGKKITNNLLLFRVGSLVVRFPQTPARAHQLVDGSSYSYDLIIESVVIALMIKITHFLFLYLFVD